MGQITNYSRFYAILNKMAYSGDKSELKECIVREYTGNRTSSLREMTLPEYTAACDDMEQKIGYEALRKKKRSSCLKQMQKMGIDTTDWTRINNFCMNARIAGKPFARLTPEELDKLSTKLRTIERNGGLKQKEEKAPEQVQKKQTFFVFPLDKTILN